MIAVIAVMVVTCGLGFCQAVTLLTWLSLLSGAQ
jgi:hypothetical protein